MDDVFNYYDELKFGSFQNWVSYINQHYLEANAPTVKIFKLDKDSTVLDELYNERVYSRIYLKPFNLRAFYTTNPFDQLIGSSSMPYMESEEEMIFVTNFDNMVNTIREIKNKKVSEVFISYSGSGEPTALKTGNYLTLKVNGKVVKEFNLELSENRTTKKLVDRINLVDGFYSYFEGENDASSNLVSFRETRLKNSKLNIYTPDSTFANVTEVIEKGDLILTDKWRLYEVMSNVPTGDIGWEYSQFTLKCKLMNLDEAQLPNNYSNQIRKRQHGITHKVDMEVGRG